MPVLDTPPTVNNHDVPVFIFSDEDLKHVNWDITIQEVYSQSDCRLTNNVQYEKLYQM